MMWTAASSSLSAEALALFATIAVADLPVAMVWRFLMTSSYQPVGIMSSGQPERGQENEHLTASTRRGRTSRPVDRDPAPPTARPALPAGHERSGRPLP